MVNYFRLDGEVRDEQCAIDLGHLSECERTVGRFPVCAVIHWPPSRQKVEQPHTAQDESHGDPSGTQSLLEAPSPEPATADGNAPSTSESWKLTGVLSQKN